MNLSWKRKLPTGEALKKEAEHLGVSQHGTYKGTESPQSAVAGRRIVTLEEGELQGRVLAARAEHRGATLNMIQTVGIIGTLVLTVALAVWNHREQVDEQHWNHRIRLEEEQAQSNKESAELMFKFDERLSSGESAPVTTALEMQGSLDNSKVSDEQIDDFLGNYELLAEAYEYKLINREMAEDAFSWQLERALNDVKIRSYLTQQRREEGDFSDGVLELARAWKIAFPPLAAIPSSSARAAPVAPPMHVVPQRVERH